MTYRVKLYVEGKSAIYKRFIELPFLPFIGLELKLNGADKAFESSPGFKIESVEYDEDTGDLEAWLDKDAVWEEFIIPDTLEGEVEIFTGVGFARI